MVKRFRPGLCALLCVALLTGLHAADTQTYAPRDEGNRFTLIPDAALRIITAGEEAFAAQDAEASGAHLAEDYTWYHITPQRPQQMIKGREQTVALLDGFFGNASWLESEVHRLGVLDNLLVQVEVDTVATADGPQTRRSITVYEFKDGQRWREWKFFPSSAPGR